MKKINFKDMPETGTVETILLLKNAQEKEARNGSTYLSLLLADGKSETRANMWQQTLAKFSFPENVLVEVVLDVTPYNGRPSYTVKKIRQVEEEEGFTMADFIPTAPEKPEELFDKCMNLAFEIKNTELMQLVTTIYDKNKEKLLLWGAAKAMHHNIVGGLLWHSYRVACTAKKYAEIYNELDADVVVAGALLHDIGKLSELETDDYGTSEYTVDGSLFGHLFIGIEAVKKYGAELGTSENIIKQMCHIIASHHGKQEYGAIVVPATPEAYAVYSADNIDARMFIFEKCLDEMESGDFSERQIMLDGARVYKF